MDAREEIAIVPIEAPTTPPPNLEDGIGWGEEMDKEEKTQLEAPKESELADIPEITEENKTLKTKDQEEDDNAITETGTVKNIDAAVEEIGGAGAAEESMKEEIKEAVIAVNNATEQTAETTELVKEEAKDQSDETATAVAPKESTEISSRDANITHDTQSEAGQKKEEDEKVTREIYPDLQYLADLQEFSFDDYLDTLSSMYPEDD